MGNSASSIFGNSEQAKENRKNAYYKKQFDSYVTGDNSKSSLVEMLGSIQDMEDYSKWSKHFLSKNDNDKGKVTDYVKKQNLDAVTSYLNENYEQAYYSLLMAETMQGAAKKKGMKLEKVDILPIEESLELVAGKMTFEERLVADAVSRTKLDDMVNGVAYQGGRVGSKDNLETNITQAYIMSIMDIGKKDYMQSYGGLSIAKGLKNIVQREYGGQDVQSGIRGVAPLASSFSDRSFGSSVRQF